MHTLPILRHSVLFLIFSMLSMSGRADTFEEYALIENTDATVGKYLLINSQAIANTVATKAIATLISTIGAKTLAENLISSGKLTLRLVTKNIMQKLWQRYWATMQVHAILTVATSLTLAFCIGSGYLYYTKTRALAAAHRKNEPVKFQ